QMITDLNLGGLVISKNGSNGIVRLQMQVPSDPSQSCTNYGVQVELPIELPGNKHFIRIRALGPR
ncbi:MAG: hypothetical protein ACKOB0_05285, partial [Chthoniobacterales bacterium]